MKSLLVLLFALAVSSCVTQEADPSVANAELYFPPNFRYVAEPRFCFRPAERRRALDVYRELGADTLFEIVIDPEGKVRKARLLRSSVDRDYHDDVESHARQLVFTPELTTELYRAFYFPVTYSRQAEFQWM